MAELNVAAEEHGTNAKAGKRQRVRREEQLRQNRQDIAAFRERMQRLADNLTEWLEGYEVSITRREMVPVSSAGAYTIPCIALHCGRNWAGFTPQALYSVKGGIQIKGEVTLAVDNSRRHPRTEKYMLCMPGHLLSTADWAIHPAGRLPDKGNVLTRELLMRALAPLFDDA
ncbi:hypothetical protein G9387_06405 [Enterobacter hormaechei]|uniref:hypothetical protein n=1 Tax=Enterobacter hormaechei TaxID=158836 RepID=UPI0013EFC0C0|nr:hypothetical protein [Enterobacter hormaechei]KAF6706030.1 hypothetical protein G9393_07330 [Enterobacter hormaechei]KAF6712817.1 hypothetical protein G9387_06405 [Enterobacter hormaechei]